MFRFYYLIILFIIIADLQTKVAINKIFSEGDYVLINDFISFNKVFNKGVVFGIGHTDLLFFNILITIAIAIILVFLIYYFICNQKYFSRTALIAWSFLIGGGAANFIDRLLNGHVTDFIIIHYENYYFPGIFNVADTFISISIFLLIIDLIFNHEKNCTI